MSTSALPRGEEGQLGGDGAEVPENARVAPPFPSGLKLNHQETFKQLTEEYEKVGSAPKVFAQV